MTGAQQAFLDALNDLARQQMGCVILRDGLVHLQSVSCLTDFGRCSYTVTFDWFDPRPGERYYDVDSTATDLRDRDHLPRSPRQIPAAVSDD